MRLLPIITAGLLTAHSLSAGTAYTDAQPVSEPEFPPARPTLKVSSDYVFESDFEDPEFGSQDALRYGALFTVPFMLTEKWQLKLGGGYIRTELGSSGAPLPTTLENAYGLIGLEYLVNGQPAIFFQTRPGLQSAGDLESDSFDSPTILTGAVKLNKDLVLVGGAIYSRFRKYQVLPIAGLIWTPNETVTVNALLPEPTVDIKLNEDTTVYVGGELAGGSYRVSDGEAYAGDSLDYMELRGGAGIKHQFTDWCGIQVGGGWVFMREFEYDDADRRIELEGSPFVKVGIWGSF